MTPVNVLMISGSLRTGSYNTVLLEALAARLPAPIRTTLFDGLAALPPFTPDLDIHDLRTDDSPPSVVAFRRLVREHDLLVITTPEYAHQIPGMLKNGLDWLVSSDAIVGKPTVVLSASTSDMGGDKAQAQLTALLKVISGNVIGEAGRSFGRINRHIDTENGDISPELDGRLNAIAATLRTAMEG